MTTGQSAEGLCGSCGHYMHAAMRIDGQIVQWDTYCSDCNNEHPFIPPLSKSEQGGGGVLLCRRCGHAVTGDATGHYSEISCALDNCIGFVPGTPFTLPLRSHPEVSGEPSAPQGYRCRICGRVEFLASMVHRGHADRYGHVFDHDPEPSAPRCETCGCAEKYHDAGVEGVAVAMCYGLQDGQPCRDATPHPFKPATPTPLPTDEEVREILQGPYVVTEVQITPEIAAALDRTPSPRESSEWEAAEQRAAEDVERGDVIQTGSADAMIRSLHEAVSRESSAVRRSFARLKHEHFDPTVYFTDCKACAATDEFEAAVRADEAIAWQETVERAFRERDAATTALREAWAAGNALATAASRLRRSGLREDATNVHKAVIEWDATTDRALRALNGQGEGTNDG